MNTQNGDFINKINQKRGDKNNNCSKSKGH